MLRMPFSEVRHAVEKVLRKAGFGSESAALAARLIAEANLDGVGSVGLDRLPLFLRQIDAGLVDVTAQAECEARMGAWERWNGRKAPGNLSAHACTERAMALAREHGLGCVALSGANHWWRGGSYGWQAASAGFGLIAWSNTAPNLPPWGARQSRIGNCPLVMAVPRAESPVVLDMGLAQFSLGRLAAAASDGGGSLPVAAGFDEAGNLTNDAAAVLRSGRALPVGFWKGSALAVVLDVLASVLASGRSVCEIEPEPDRESGLSQVFLAIDLGRGCDESALPSRVGAILESVLSAEPDEKGTLVRYPGQRTLRTRTENMRLGVPVTSTIWKAIRTY